MGQGLARSSVRLSSNPHNLHSISYTSLISVVYRPLNYQPCLPALDHAVR